MTDTRPRAVVFDVGHVLYDWDPRHLYSTLIDDPAQLDHFLDSVVTRDWHFQHDAGRLFAETSAELMAKFPEHSELIAVFGPRFGDQIPGPIEGMPQLVEDLSGRGVPLYGITNFSGEFWPPFREREAALFDRFRDVIVSGTERMMKPDPAIFALAVERFGLESGEGLFVDDRPENIEAGERAGFVGHLFRDAATLRADLERRGLL